MKTLHFNKEFCENIRFPLYHTLYMSRIVYSTSQIYRLTCSLLLKSHRNVVNLTVGLFPCLCSSRNIYYEAASKQFQEKYDAISQRLQQMRPSANRINQRNRQDDHLVVLTEETLEYFKKDIFFRWGNPYYKAFQCVSKLFIINYTFLITEKHVYMPTKQLMTLKVLSLKNWSL